MPPPKNDPDGNSLPVQEGWFYLEEKTTILGAFLREPQITGCPGSTDHSACDGIKKDGIDDGIEDKVANHQVEDGGKDGGEDGGEDGGKNGGKDGGEDGSEADDADDERGGNG